ncbi:hypothetical protein E5676_scaffold443G00340 [Cucumis melo var. makuwa]|uniref:Retrovirus-related Pol polyprotein from transposon TNT 1-94-like beta-barrel domain-containing protein n=1 Tax=Cucumis melo var. makuwa TaxID=1194695 RepID=A0A5D3D751_CUCMM|nr:hypothetical protein E5676_scaffold443G00340 [Cucumis melo var. makuwa]
MVSHKDIRDAWIMDSECTFHMTPNRNFLINFQKSDGGKVLLGDNELKRNLISLSKLDRSSYTIKFKNGVMKVTKGSLVKLRRTSRNDLYVFEGTTVSGKGSDVSSDQSPLVSQIEGTEQSEFDGKQQKDAMEAKLFILRKNQTWSLVTKTPIQKLIQLKWFKPGGDSKPRHKIVTVSFNKLVSARFFRRPHGKLRRHLGSDMFGYHLGQLASTGLW